MNQGESPTFGAIGHWGGGPVNDPNEPDVGWGPNGEGSDILTTQGRWAQLSWVYDGLEDRVFIDGALSNSEEHPSLLNVHATYNDGNPTLVCLGSSSDEGSANNAPVPFSGTIARVEIYASAWTNEEIETALYRVLSQKPDFYFGGCHQIFGILYARLPGVELNKSISQFETAITKGPDFFGNYVARAKYLYPRVSDKESFEIELQYSDEGGLADPYLFFDIMTNKWDLSEFKKHLLEAQKKCRYHFFDTKEV